MSEPQDEPQPEPRDDGPRDITGSGGITLPPLTPPKDDGE